MATPVKDVVTKSEKVELEHTDVVALKVQNNNNAPHDEAKEEEVAVELEPKSRVSFPVKLNDAKQLNAVGLMTKTFFRMDIKFYGFGT